MAIWLQNCSLIEKYILCFYRKYKYSEKCNAFLSIFNLENRTVLFKSQVWKCCFRLDFPKKNKLK